MAAPRPESRQPHVTTSNDTESIPQPRGGTTGGRYEAHDHSHQAFIAAVGQRTLEANLVETASAWLEAEYGQPAPLTELGRWLHVRGDKRDYRAHQYEDDKGRPRLHVIIHNHATAENTRWDDYAEVFEPTYRTWLEQQRDLTAAERADFAQRQDERRQDAEKRAAERAAKLRDAAQKAQQEAEEEAQRLAAAIERWHTLPSAISNPYFSRKGLEGRTWRDARQDGNKLALAVRNPLTDNVVGIQYITDTAKWFETGTPKKGSCIWVTGIPPASAKCFDLAEGWASAASCALALEREKPKAYAVSAIDAGNLEHVYKAIKQRWPRARIVLPSDNDAGTALKTDASGKPKPNTGQVKAHTLALKVGCKVAIPHIPGRSGVNVDFNDVHRECGLEAVRLQLRGARNPDPTFAVPHTPDKGLKRGYALAKRYGCTIDVSAGRYLELPATTAGVTILRASMGTGKTEAVARWLKAHPDLSAIAISHLQGLTGSLATRLEASDYRDIPNGRERDHPRAAFCVNSLWRLLDPRTQAVRHADVLFIDEIDQLLRRLTSRRDFARKRQCLEVLEHLVRKATYVLGASAHIDDTTMKWLRRLRPQDAPQMVLSSYTPGSGRTVHQYERRGDVRAQARDALRAGKAVYYALNGLERAHEVSGWLAEVKEARSDLRILLVCSETAGEEDVQAFFRAPSTESSKYDLIVASPSVSTGVSIDGGHFALVCGEFSARVGTPHDALQALSRVRGAPELHVWVDPRRAANVTDRDTIQAGFWRDVGDDAAMGAGVDTDSGKMKIDAGYAELYLDVKIAEARAVNTYARTLWQLVVEDDYPVRYGARADDAEKIEQHARDTAKAAHKEALLAARDLDDDEARALLSARAQRQMCRADSAALERHDLLDFYRPRNPEEELPDLIDADRDDDLRRQIQNLELSCSGLDVVDGLMQQQHDADTLAPDVRRYDQRHHAYSTTLRAANLDLETLQAGERYTDADLRDTWIKPLAKQWHIYRVTVPSWPTLEYAEAQPVKALGGVLRGAFGLSQRRTGKTSGGSYVLSVKPLEVRRGWIAWRREQMSPYIKTLTVTSVPSPKPTFTLLPGPEADPVAYLSYLLEAGKLAALGEHRTATVRKKLKERAMDWLTTLACSPDLRRVLEVAA